MGRVVAGLVGRLDVESLDGREVAAGGFRVGGLPLPLMLLTGPGEGHGGAEVAGVIVAAGAQDGEVRIVGSTFEGVDLPPGRYPCGMDLRDVVSELVRVDNGEALSDADVGAVFGGGEWPELVSRTVSGELVAVTIYGPGSTARAVWDGVEVTVGG